MPGHQHRDKRTEHRRRNHAAGIVFIAAARTDQQRQQKRRAIGQRQQITREAEQAEQLA
ncbi:hypothetical protein D3C78_1635110 [compost metagenome]